MKSIYRLANGRVYYPHISKEGDFILSHDPHGSDVRFEENYIREPDPVRFHELAITRKYHIRMKAEGIAPSMIRPESLEIADGALYLNPVQLKHRWAERRNRRQPRT